VWPQPQRPKSSKPKISSFSGADFRGCDIFLLTAHLNHPLKYPQGYSHKITPRGFYNRRHIAENAESIKRTFIFWGKQNKLISERSKKSIQARSKNLPKSKLLTLHNKYSATIECKKLSPQTIEGLRGISAGKSPSGTYKTIRRRFQRPIFEPGGFAGSVQGLTSWVWRRRPEPRLQPSSLLRYHRR